jgi:hypothetical protein
MGIKFSIEPRFNNFIYVLPYYIPVHPQPQNRNHRSICEGSRPTTATGRELTPT